MRLIGASPRDVQAVEHQLGPFSCELARAPDIIVRYEPPSGSPVTYVGLGGCFSESHYLLSRKSSPRDLVAIPFADIGTAQCEIRCSPNLGKVPLLLHIVILTFLSKGVYPLHASAFCYQGQCNVLTGWAKGGKTEAMLAFARHGAAYLGDEWILVADEGESVLGLPEKIRLWEWHLPWVPHVRERLAWHKRLSFASIGALDRLLTASSSIRTSAPGQILSRAMPILRRQRYIIVDPREVFPTLVDGFRASPNRLFLMLSHDQDSFRVVPDDALVVAERMTASVVYETRRLQEHYQAYCYAFPGRRNPFLDSWPRLLREGLVSSLGGKPAYRVSHPYPCSLERLFEVMEPSCKEGSGAPP